MSDGLTLATFWQAWDLFEAPTMSAVFAGALLGWLSIFVVLRRMIFVSAALSQGASFGVTGAYFVQIHLGISASLASPQIGAILVTSALALFLGRKTVVSQGPPEIWLGLAYLVGTAGTLALGTRIVQELQDVESLLLGSAVAVSPDDYRFMVGISVALLLLHLWWHRGFLQTTLDRDGALIRNLPVILLESVLLLSIAVAISVATRILGALPVFAFSTLPAIAGLRAARSPLQAFSLATVLGASMGFFGYLLAFLYELPVGPTQTMVGAGIVAAAYVLPGAERALVRTKR